MLCCIVVCTVYNNFHPSAPPQPVVQTLSQETGTEYSLESDYEPSDHSSLTISIRQGDFTNILSMKFVCIVHCFNLSLVTCYIPSWMVLVWKKKVLWSCPCITSPLEFHEITCGWHVFMFPWEGLWMVSNR